MMRGFRKLLSGGLIMTFVFLAACSSNQGGGTGTTVSNPTQESQSAASEAPKQEEPAEISIMANFTTAEASVLDQAVIDVIQEKLNVKLKFIVPPATGYEEQLQLTLISGEYPDVVFFKNTTSEAYLNAVNDGLLIPLNKYVEKSPSLMEYTYPVSWEALKSKGDDDIYGIPRTTIVRYDNFTVRKDWLEKIGFEVPADHEITIDQFTDILRKFTFEDPDGNGKNDTYGYSGFLNDSKVMDLVLSSPFGDFGWQEVTSGDYKYMTPMYDQNSDVYKKALNYTRMLYTEGLIDPDAAVIDSSASYDRFVRGITGVRKEFAGYYVNSENSIKETSDPNAETTYLFVKGLDGKVEGAAFGTGVYGMWSITNKAKHPDKVAEVFDYLLSEEGYKLLLFGVEGVNFNTVDGKRVYVEGDFSSPWKWSMVRRANDTDFFVNPDGSKEEIERLKPVVDKAVQSVKFSKDYGYIPSVARETNYMNFKLTWDETIMKIIIGEKQIDAFDKLVQDWYAQGGKNFVEQMNDYIAGIAAK